MRPLLRVEITARMGSFGGALVNADLMSVWERGLPVTMETFGCAVTVLGRRTSAVMVCERETASEMTWVPVRPLAPRRRMRIFLRLRVYRCPR